MGLTVEVCFLVGADGAVLWADRSASAVALPDSRRRWEEIWRCRDRLAEIAHSHPSGLLRFSAEDETTMAAIDDALAGRLRYSVVCPQGMLTRSSSGARTRRRPEPWWAALLRAASGIPVTTPTTRTPIDPCEEPWRP